MDIDVGGGVLTDLGNEEMRDYIIEYVSASIDEYQLDVYRIDFNMPALPAWRARDAINCPPPPQSDRTCPAFELHAGFDVPGFDMCSFEMPSNGATAKECAAACW